MNDEPWQEAILPPVNEDCVWELFHENSKVVRSGHALSDNEVVSRMKEFYLSLPFTGNPSIELPRRLSALKVPLEKAIVSRISVRNMEPCRLEVKSVATLLHYAYGESRDNKGTGLPRPFRVVPSGGRPLSFGDLFLQRVHRWVGKGDLPLRSLNEYSSTRFFWRQGRADLQRDGLS